MATVVKDFKIKNGLVVEGQTGTIDGQDILTKKQDDQDYIVGLIGGTSTSVNTPDTVVKRDGSGNFAAGTVTANLVGDVTGNADTATTLESALTINVLGDATGSVEFEGNEGEVTLTLTLDSSFATDAEVATAKGEAIDAAASDATTKANAAQAAAELTASNALSSAVTDLEGQIADAETDANAYTDNAITALNLAGTYDALGAAAQALSDAEDYTDAAVANLVDGAPALLDTLNELAAAIADNPNYATDVANLVATKADTSYVDSEISDLDSAAQGYANTAQSNAESFATTAANNAQSAAEDYADGLAVNYDAAGSASAAQSAAQSYADGLDSATNTRIDNLTTDDVEEGNNMYFTDSRATNAAGTLLANSSQTNISISYDSNTQSLTVSAENGIADSDTDDLLEGTTNLYFTNQRAVDALEAVVPNFEAVEIDSLAKQVAATVSVPTASTVTGFSWAAADYRTAKFLVKTAYGTHTDVAEVLLTLDTSDNIAITEYAMVGTNGSAMTISADVSAGDVRLRVATVNNNSTVTVVGTLLA